jgi:hypothetical protein
MKRLNQLPMRRAYHQPNACWIARACASLLVLLVALSSASRAATFTVTNLNDSGAGSLRQAVSDANANAGADTISFQPGLIGTITLTTGEIVVYDELTIAGPGAEMIAISGNHASGIFTCEAFFGTVAFSDLALVDADAFGGAIFLGDGRLTLTNCTFTGNSGSNGGAITSYRELHATNCTFANNHADASSLSAGRGGAIYGNVMTLTNCVFTANEAREGGAMYMTDDYLATVTNCTFTGNSADSGGAIFNFDSGPRLTNCLFNGNQAGSGGGVYNFGSSPKLTNCTFSANVADAGGAMFSRYGAVGGSPAGLIIVVSRPTLDNGILWGDTAAIGAELYHDNSNPLYPSMTTVSHSDVQGGLPAATIDAGGNLDSDPLFVGPATGDLHLSPGSPCIDAGDSSAPGLIGITTDPDGNPRFVGSAVDMGAFEFQADTTPPVISNLSASPNRLWPPDNKLVDITVTYSATDNSGQAPTCSLSVSSNDPDSDADDVVIIDAHHLKLRASKAKRGRERLYTITVTCTDLSGNTSTAQTTVTVPHSNGHGN